MSVSDVGIAKKITSSDHLVTARVVEKPDFYFVLLICCTDRRQAHTKGVRGV